MHTTHFVGNGEIQTAFHDLGGNLQDPLLLVHGFTGSKLDFSDQLGWFEDVARGMAYDQRGHGESSNQGPYTESVFVEDLISLMDLLEIGSCDLLGHSFGGMVAMRAVLDHPERFRSLILMDTSAEPAEMFTKEIKQHLDALVAEQGCAVLTDSMRGARPSAAAQRGIDFLGEAEHWQRISTKLNQMDPDAFRDIGDYFGTRTDLLPEFGRIDCEVTVMVGAADEPFLGQSKAMADAIPQAVLEVIPQAGHSPQYENAPAWRKVIRSHLQRVSQPAASAGESGPDPHPGDARTHR